MPDNISAHISYREATHSQTAVRLGLSNDPGPVELANMRRVAEQCFEPARAHFGGLITVSSFYRAPRVNKAIGGAVASQHVQGEAIDMDCDGSAITNAQLFHWLKDNVEFDQIIWEFGTELSPDWVHASFREGDNRKHVLRARRNGGKTAYTRWADKEAA